MSLKSQDRTVFVTVFLNRRHLLGKFLKVKLFALETIWISLFPPKLEDTMSMISLNTEHLLSLLCSDKHRSKWIRQDHCSLFLFFIFYFFKHFWNQDYKRLEPCGKTSSDVFCASFVRHFNVCFSYHPLPNVHLFPVTVL